MSVKKIVEDLVKHGVSLLGDEGSPCVVNEWLSTGCVALDVIMGGGLPVGRVTEIYGDTSTGKSLIAAQVAALAQEDGHIVVMVDTETAVSLPIMEAVGVDISNMLYATPDTVEEVFTIFEKAIVSKAQHDPDKLLLLIWDSIAATSVMMEMNEEYGKAMMGRHAAIISQGLRKITRHISKGRVCALFLNQTRQKLGILYGDNEATFGGKAVSFYSSVRVRLKLSSKIKSKERIIGIDTVASVVKNKVAVPFRDARLPIIFGHGIDDAMASFHYLDKNGIFERSGSWYTLKGIKGKFQRSTWDGVYDEHYDHISNMIWEHAE